MRRLLLFPFLFFLSGSLYATENPRLMVKEELFSVDWGVGEATLARIDPNESDGEAPSSFAVTPWGDIYVLDQVQGRVAVFTEDGLLLRSVPLPARTFLDIDFAPDGRLVLMDRLMRQSLLLLDESTGATEEFTFTEFGLEEGGLVTAMLVLPDGVWLEYGHRFSIRVLNERAMPGGLRRVPGRPASGPNHWRRIVGSWFFVESDSRTTLTAILTKFASWGLPSTRTGVQSIGIPVRVLRSGRKRIGRPFVWLTLHSKPSRVGRRERYCASRQSASSRTSSCKSRRSAIGTSKVVRKVLSR